MASTQQTEKVTAEPLVAEVSLAQCDPTADPATPDECAEPVPSIAQTEGAAVESLLAEGYVAQSDPVADTAISETFPELSL